MEADLLPSTKTKASIQAFHFLSDEALCTLFQQTHQQDIIVELLGRYERYLIALAIPFQRHIDSLADFNSDLFLHVYQALQQAKPRVFKHWLGRMARNKLCDIAKKHKPVIRAELPDQACSYAETWEIGIDVQLVWDMIQQLAPDQRFYLEMVYLQGYKQREITQLMGWPKDKARKVRQNAIRNLRKKMSHSQHEFVHYLKTA